MKTECLITALWRLLRIGISMVVILILNLGGLVQPRTGWTIRSAMAQIVPDSTVQVAGDYSGVVKFQFTVAGVYSDTLPTRIFTGSPDRDNMDLALSLKRTDNTLSGYINLDKLLGRSIEHAGQTAAVLNGSFDGIRLKLTSERVSATSGGQSIQRQVHLTGAISRSDGSQLSGQYRETIWGVADQPVTMIGVFGLQRPRLNASVPVPTNQAPKAVGDTAITGQKAAVTIHVLANDSDANGDGLTVTSVSKPHFGTATTDGQVVTYTPHTCFITHEHFRYFISDGKGETAAGTVTVTMILTGQPSANVLHLP